MGLREKYALVLKKNLKTLEYLEKYDKEGPQSTHNFSGRESLQNYLQ